MSLDRLRVGIDKIYTQLLELLNERARKVLEIASAKKAEGRAYYDPSREKRVIEKLFAINKGPLPSGQIEEIFRTILQSFLSLQRTLRIAYLGPPATYTHLAAMRNFGRQAEYLPARDISEIFMLVDKQKSDYGVVPVENSTEGVVSHTLDMFLDSDLKIYAEITLEVIHHLLGRGDLKSIRDVYSHPQAIAQCRLWLERYLPDASYHEMESTTRAVQLASERTDTAAIASEVAAQMYEMNILESHIEDSPHNYTRFLVIGPEYAEPSGADKTSILFSIKDKVGALYGMLEPFRRHSINLTKIESRPTKRKAWEYVFFLDFVGHKDDVSVQQALAELEQECLFLKVLGSYTQAD